MIFPGEALGARPWWMRLLARFHHHVFLAREQGKDATLVVEMLGLRMHVDLVPTPIGWFVAERLSRPGAWVLLGEASSEDRPMLRPCMTCVEVVKATLGISAWGVWTPWQLKRHLRRRGFLPVLPIGGGDGITVQQAEGDQRRPGGGPGGTDEIA